MNHFSSFRENLSYRNIRKSTISQMMNSFKLDNLIHPKQPFPNIMLLICIPMLPSTVDLQHHPMRNQLWYHQSRAV